MLFAAPVVAAMAYGPLVALVVTKKSGIRKAEKKTLSKEIGTTEPAEGFDANGLITTWKLASPEDTRLLKELVTSGALIKDQARGINMKPDEVKAQFPRFKRFSNSCLSSKVSNLRRDFRDAIEKRARSMSSQVLFVNDSFTTSSSNIFFSSFFSGERTWWRQMP